MLANEFSRVVIHGMWTVRNDLGKAELCFLIDKKYKSMMIK